MHRLARYLTLHFTLTAVGLFLLAADGALATDNRPPNVVFILADDKCAQPMRERCFSREN